MQTALRSHLKRCPEWVVRGGTELGSIRANTASNYYAKDRYVRSPVGDVK
jgi:hypothetical protein